MNVFFKSGEVEPMKRSRTRPLLLLGYLLPLVLIPIVLIAILLSPKSHAQSPADHSTQAGGPARAPTRAAGDQCDGRIAGPGGTFIAGPALVIRTYDGLAGIDNADTVVMEYCLAKFWAGRAENVGTLGEADYAYWALTVVANVHVNGFQIIDPMVPTPPLTGHLSAFDGTEDFDGTSGDMVVSDIDGTIVSVPISLNNPDGTPNFALCAAFSSDFVIGFETRGDSIEDVTGGVHGAVGFFWRAGLNFRVVPRRPGA